MPIECNLVNLGDAVDVSVHGSVGDWPFSAWRVCRQDQTGLKTRADPRLFTDP